jgi:hypothetical protein
MNLLLVYGRNLECILRKTRNSTVEILAFSVRFFKRITNLKSRNNNKANAPEMLLSADIS